MSHIQELKSQLDFDVILVGSVNCRRPNYLGIITEKLVIGPSHITLLFVSVSEQNAHIFTFVSFLF